MRKKQVWRYYCDYCNRGKCQPQTGHELHCTMNPERTCLMCKRGEMEQRPMSALVWAAGKKLSALLILTKCPACILAGIRQAGKSGHYDFDYTAACKQFWADVDG